MAGSITLALRTAQSGLIASQQALDSVANNISNANSEGYSRKVANLEQRVVAGAGAGVQLSEVARKVDEGLLKSLRLQYADHQQLDVQGDYYARVQEMFGAPGDNTSFSHIMEDFVASLETLSVSPDKVLEMSDAVRWGQDITEKLQAMSTTIQDLRVQADTEIAEVVARINELSTKIADLNDKIIRNSSVNFDVTDLQDQRDQAIDEMAQLIDIRYFKRSDGDVVVFTNSGRTLVDNVPPTVTHTAISASTPYVTHGNGISGIYVGEAIDANDLTDEVAGGKIKGLIDMRDDVLVDIQAQLDEFAAMMRDTVNQIHNRGVSFPGAASMSGSRAFTQTSVQKIYLDSAGTADDVAISLFDSSGNQQASVRLNTLMQNVNTTYGGAADYSSRGAGNDWTIDVVASSLQTWLNHASGGGLTGATVSVTSGKMAIDLNSTTRYIAFRDESAATNGSSNADAVITFDSDGDNTADETVNGFSNFFGLNDFFTDNLGDNVHESNVLATTYSATAASTLVFEDSTGALTGSPLTVNSGDSLSTIATNITNNITNVTAQVVSDGSGSRLRVFHSNGSDMTITQTAGTFLTDVGMHVADAGVAAAVQVRSDILSTPTNMVRGGVQWDSSKGSAGEYYLANGDDTIIKALAEQMTTTNSFSQAGGIGSLTTTFTDYAASVISYNADLADDNKIDTETEENLVNSLQYKSDAFRGVNLDEEMAQLILYEQAYSATARVISVIQEMFDTLDRAF